MSKTKAMPGKVDPGYGDPFDDSGKPFATFDAFCLYRQPWGLGFDPTKLKAHIAAEKGQKFLDLEVVPPDRRSSRDRDEEGQYKPAIHLHNDCANGDSASRNKESNLRAILRAPEVVQDLYREGLINQTTAAKLGPKKPTADQAITLVEIREALDAKPRPETEKEKKQFRKEADEIVKAKLGIIEDPVSRLKPALMRLDPLQLHEVAAIVAELIRSVGA